MSSHRKISSIKTILIILPDIKNSISKITMNN